MLRASHRKGFATIACLPLMITTAARAESTWRVYDVRDLIAQLPATDDPPLPAPTPARQSVFSSEPPPPPQAPEPDSVQKTVKALADRLATDYMPMFPGVFGIEAEDANHEQIRKVLLQLRQLYQERYAVEISMFETETANAPSLGSAVPVAPHAKRHGLIVTRRSPTDVSVTTSRAFVADFEPIVATGAIGYASEVKHTEEGLRLSVLVGAGEESPDSTSLAVSGFVRDIQLERQSDSIFAEDAGLRLDLPTAQERSIRAQFPVPFGNAHAIAVVPGFEDGQTIVVTASVRKLPHRVTGL